MTALRLASSILAITTATIIGFAAPALASDKDRKFFSSVEGSWSGPGEIVAGKYKGTKFVCNFTGATPNSKLGMSLDGGCRMGLFTQRMQASVEHQGRAGYRGSFMDGSDGTGLDVIAGKVANDRVTFTLNRNQLNGAMLARMADPETMTVTVSVLVDDQMVPVIGMNLKRVDKGSVGSIANR
ncbi:MAG: hypothetical protein ABW191_00365 [Aliihoeflea sp.]|jgi:hypothetical protein